MRCQGASRVQGRASLGLTASSELGHRGRKRRSGNPVGSQRTERELLKTVTWHPTLALCSRSQLQQSPWLYPL